MEDLKKIQEFFSNPLEENTFKVGQKVTYLGHPAEITSVEDRYGKTFVSLSYDKGTGKTKVRGILSTDGSVKPLEENAMAQFTDYSNNELLAYYKNTKDPKAKEELHKRSQKLKALTRTDEATVNYDFSKKELIRVLQQLKRGASTEIGMIKAFEKALGRELTDDEIRGFKLNEAEEDPIDIVTMDVPLFIRILEYAREDAQDDMDLHDLAQKAIAATKQQGILQMDDYDMLVGELEQISMEENMSLGDKAKSYWLEKFKKGEITKLPEDPIEAFLDQMMKDQMAHDKETLRRERGLEETIREIIETIKLGQNLNESTLCKRGQDYIKARKAAGEKSSAYLSGRAVKVCKGDIEFRGKKQKDFKG